jgi:hypothetical protein
MVIGIKVLGVLITSLKKALNEKIEGVKDGLGKEENGEGKS